MQTPIASNRIVSLDVMRGIIMILLAAEACRVYDALNDLSEGSSAQFLVQQFFHHEWNGLRFWDLVQPAFMTMAGTAMYISFINKQKKGISWQQNFPHIALRCLKLLICGTALHCIYAGELVWELWNVLTQLSVTTLIAYLIIRKSFGFQLAVSAGLLLLTELLYRTVLMPAFDQPFTEHKNFGAYMDMVLMGKINDGGWVTINCIPTAAHTIWGCLAGKVLLNTSPAISKIRVFIIAGLIGLVLGFGLDWLHITPIIKRIATSAFTLASGGYVFLILAFCYWLVDVKKFSRYAWVPIVVGMNSIFIYLVFETVGHQWVNKAIAVFVKGFTGLAGAAEHWQNMFSALVSWFFMWYLCYWLYKQKIFFKL